MVIITGSLSFVAWRREAWPFGDRYHTTVPALYYTLTAADLGRMSDAQLERMDPLAMNLIVARELPPLRGLDIAQYSATVDEWARQIDEGNRAIEPQSKADPTYKVSREFWMAGGMAVALAGPRFGIRYTTQAIDEGNPAQQFVYGVIDAKMGTCASMPVLYLAIAHRLHWPLKAVVSKDHMWTRWDDGVPKEKGGQQFNLEATNSKSDGAWGSFSSPSDAEYGRWLGTPQKVIDSGSDFTSLTARQTLGVYLQGRAAWWLAHGYEPRAVEDLKLAVACFPKNVDIQRMLAHATGQDRSPDWRRRGSTQTADADRINRLNQEALRRLTATPAPATAAPPPY